MARPVFTRRLGHLEIALFANGDANREKPFGVTLSRRYFDSQAEEWKNSAASLNESDLAAARELLSRAQDWLLSNQRQQASDAAEER